MKCENFLAALDAADNGRQASLLDAAMRSHAAGCPRCSQALELNRRWQALCRLDPSLLRVDLSDRIMAAVMRAEHPQRAMAVSLWLAAGLVIFGSGLLLPLLAGHQELSLGLGTGYIIPQVLVSGISLSLFILVFVGSQLGPIGAYLRRHNWV